MTIKIKIPENRLEDTILFYNQHGYTVTGGRLDRFTSKYILNICKNDLNEPKNLLINRVKLIDSRIRLRAKL